MTVTCDRGRIDRSTARKHLIIPAEVRPAAHVVTPANNTHTPSAANSAAAAIPNRLERNAIGGELSGEDDRKRRRSACRASVPTTTAGSDSKRAASTAVAICVLSPILGEKERDGRHGENAKVRRLADVVLLEPGRV